MQPSGEVSKPVSYDDTQLVLGELEAGLHLQWYDREFARARLREQDAGWLAQLSGKPVSDELLERANRLVAVGSIDMSPGNHIDPEVRSNIVRARTDFYENVLGWVDEQHPLHRAYQTLCDMNITTMPLATVIGTQRTLSAYGIDAARVISVKPSILGLAPESVDRKIGYLRRLQAVLGWRGSLSELIDARPGILGDSTKKLGVLARIAADHGNESWQTMETKKIIGATISPIDSHLAAVAHDDTYRLGRANYYQRRYKGSERRSHSLELLGRPDTQEKLGKKVVRAYLRYKPLRTN